MLLLRNLVVGVIVLVITKVLTLLLDRYSPASLLYHRQFIFCLQLVVLSWMLITCCLYAFKATRSSAAHNAWIGLFVFMFVGDGLFYVLLHNPHRIPAVFIQPFSRYYTDFDRNILQYQRYYNYDSAFFYRVIPNSQFSFSNIEFNNTYQVNKRSFRDDDISLQNPAVICAGDSYAFGWGVNDSDTYPSLLEKSIGKKVLNAGQSSYATVRELNQLALVDTSMLQWLIIQYNRNDDGENDMYIRKGRTLAISSRETYQLAKKQHAWSQQYFPGKYSVSISYDLIRTELRRIKHGTRLPTYLRSDRSAAAKNFLEVLLASNISTTVNIIVLDLDGPYEMNSSFINAVDSISRKAKYRSVRQRLWLVDLTKTLTPDHFYQLDTHMNPKGHKAVANRLSDIINTKSSTHQP